MSEEARKANVLNWLLAAASVVIIIAGMKAAQSLVVPFLVSAFLAVICAPAVDWLQKKRVPEPIALTLVIVGVTLVLVLIIGIASKSISDFTTKVPTYQAQLTERVDDVTTWLEENLALGTESDEGEDSPELSDPNTVDLGPEVIGVDDDPNADLAGTFEAAAPPPEIDYFEKLLDPPRLVSWFTGFLFSLSSLFSNVLLVLLTLIFMLAEASGLPRKLVAITGGRQQLVNESSRIRDAILRYMSLKTIVSVLTGLLAGTLVWLLGVHYPVLWGLLAFFFNYVPNIGSFIAAIPPVLLALIEKDLNCALMMGIGYGAINGIIGNFVEPRMMGKGLGLSTLIVFLSLVFWGWVLGPVGMLLSVPLTMIVKIGLENFEQTRWLAILLGSNPEPEK